MNNIQKDIDLLFELNSADIEALEDAKGTLQVIKEADPGVYDEIINETLLLINKALKMSCTEAIERIAEKLGVET